MLMPHAFHPTRATREVLNVLEHAARTASTALVCGESGCGKSALAGWLDHTSNTVLVVEPEVPNSPRAVLNDLLERMGGLPAASTREAFDALMQRLSASEVEAIVVDDAHRLARNSLEALRRLHDRSGIGLVLLGPRRLTEHVGQHCPELAARVERVHCMGLLQPHDVFGMLVARQRLSGRRSLWEVVETSRALVRQSGGNFRCFLRVLREARAIARARHRALCPAFVQRAGLGLERSA